MSEKRAWNIVPSGRFRWRADRGSVAISLLVHVLLLPLVASLYHPIRSPSSPPAAAPEVVYLDFPALPTTTSSVALSSDAANAVSSLDAASEDQSVPEVDGALASGTPAVASPSVPAAGRSPGRDVPGALLPSGFLDSRLYAELPTGRPAEPGAGPEPLEADAHAAIRSTEESIAAARQRDREARQITILGRGVTVLGDSAASRQRTLGMAAVGGRMVMPIDGRAWQDLEMQRAREAAVRDSILRERARAMRERREAELQSTRLP